MFVFGMILGLPGTVLGLPETVEQFGLTLADRGVLIATLFAGLLLGSLLSGPLVDALGQRAALILSSALVAVCLPLFALASNFPVAAAELVAIGLASASINTASNALSSELFPDERGRRMNVIAVMVGLGGLTMPTATVLASEFVSWRAVVTGGGMLSAIVAVRAATVPSVRIDGQQRDGPFAALRRFSEQPGFPLVLLLITLGGGNEAGLAGWISTFAAASGLSPSAATWVLSSHWLGLILSRVYFSGGVDRAKEIAVERSAVLAALVLLVIVATGSPVLAAVGPFVVGICMALVMPTSLALAGERFQGNPGALFGGLLTLAQVGGMLVPASIGLIAQETNVRTGLALLVATYGTIAVIVRRLTSDR
jgi:DHA1 family bicyclomycin/chloramphenicol resistance-like MFS transporter